MSRAANPLNMPEPIDYTKYQVEPAPLPAISPAPQIGQLHVIIDGIAAGQGFPGAGASPPTGGTVTPSLAQPVVNNTTNNSTTNAPVTVNVVVNVASPAAALAAVGAAVGAAAAGALTSAVKQSAAVLHDGYGPH